MPGRTYVPENKYRFGFNGKELDEEGMGGGGATYDYGFRIYNPQIARFLSMDPLAPKFPFYTPYQFAANTPIGAIDLDGLESVIVINSPLIAKVVLNLNDEGKTNEIIWEALQAASGKDGYDYTSNEADWANRQNGGGQQEGDPSAQSYNMSELSKGVKVFILNGDGSHSLIIDKTFEEAAPNVQDKNIVDKIVDWWNGVDLSGDTDYKDSSPGGKSREATSFEKWVMENVDQNEVDELLEGFGGSSSGNGDNNTLDIPDNYEDKKKHPTDDTKREIVPEMKLTPPPADSIKVRDGVESNGNPHIKHQKYKKVQNPARKI